MPDLRRLFLVHYVAYSQPFFLSQFRHPLLFFSSRFPPSQVYTTLLIRLKHHENEVRKQALVTDIKGACFVAIFTHLLSSPDRLQQLENKPALATDLNAVVSCPSLLFPPLSNPLLCSLPSRYPKAINKVSESLLRPILRPGVA